MKKLIILIMTSLFLNGCANSRSNNTTIFEDVANYATGVIIEDEEETFAVKCIGDVTLDNKEIHFREVKINNKNEVYFFEEGIRDNAYRYHVIISKYVDNIRCENQEEFNEIMKKTLVKN